MKSVYGGDVKTHVKKYCMKLQQHPNSLINETYLDVI